MLTTNGISKNDIENLRYDEKTNSLVFTCKNRTYDVKIEDSIGSYIKIYKDDNVEIINKEASCNNS